ncbi:MAG: nuclear transport factor 2 family protein [Dehalococcoidia bacterium]
MPGAKISAKKRNLIYDTLHRYVWSMDTGDIDGVIGCFTDDGVVKDVSGKRWDEEQGGASGFANHYLNRPNRAGAQHWIQPMLIDEIKDGYVIKSYWHSIKWETNPDRRFIRTIGVYTDTVVRHKGEWLIREKLIDSWNSETTPMVLDVREAIWTPHSEPPEGMHLVTSEEAQSSEGGHPG